MNYIQEFFSGSMEESMKVFNKEVDCWAMKPGNAGRSKAEVGIPMIY